jgi:hypothetical protein
MEAGFSRVAVIEGGLAGWKKLGLAMDGQSPL